MSVPTIDLVTVSDIWSTTIQDRLVYHNMLIPVHIDVVAVMNLDFLREFGKSDLKDMTIKELH